MIIRTEKNKSNSFALPTKIIEDRRIPTEAFGVLVFAISNFKSRKFDIEEVIRHGTDNKKTVKAMLKELVRLGYLERVKGHYRVKECFIINLEEVEGGAK